MKKWMLIFFVIAMIALAGCSQGNTTETTNADDNPTPSQNSTNDSDNKDSNNNNTNTNNSENTTEEKPIEDNFSSDPVTLTLYSRAAGINTEQDLLDVFVNPVQKVYPNITIEQIKDIAMDQMIVSNQIPDIIVTSNYYLRDVLDLGLGSDLTDFVKKRNIDFSRFEQATMDVMEQFSENGELLGIPYSLNYGNLLYNKDIFDLFGVDYPKDGMFWDEVIDLARQVTRNHEGTQYIGLDIGGIQVISRHRSLVSVDLKTKTALLETPEMYDVFDLYKRVYEIPGAVTPEGKFNYGVNFFMKDQRLAMLPYWIAATQSRVPTMQETGINWDMVSFPQSKDQPGLGRETDFHLFVIPPNRGDKVDAIYRVMETVISEDAQKEMNAGSRLTIYDDEDMRNSYSSAAKTFEGKNLAGIYSVAPAPAPLATKYDAQIYSIMRSAAKKVVVDGIDINTALRNAQEEANQVIKEIDGN